ncbi:hypothetical protein HDV05_002981, partial [Chytridiales sp. JEL 0842]
MQNLPTLPVEIWRQIVITASEDLDDLARYSSISNPIRHETWTSAYTKAIILGKQASRIDIKTVSPETLRFFSFCNLPDATAVLGYLQKLKVLTPTTTHNALDIVTDVYKNQTIVVSFLKAGFTPGNKLPFVAAKRGHTQILSTCADVLNGLPSSTLLAALSARKTNMVDFLLDLGVKGDLLSTLLATENGDHMVLDKILKSTDASPDQGSIALAVSRRNVPVLKVLLEAGGVADDVTMRKALKEGCSRK